MPPTEHIVGSGGADIHYLAWGPEGAPGLVFVHGGAAHAHWWSFLVPLLADDHRVAALDLSGHGDSGRRDEYTLDAWCDEVLAVANDAAMAPNAGLSARKSLVMPWTSMAPWSISRCGLM